jgi:hypothetical protein
MPAITGHVEAISIKSLNEPDRFGNLHRCSIKVGEEWVSWGTTKKPEISYKEGENYKTLQKGMEVEFMYKQNGDFKNISKTSLSVLSTEGAQSAPPPSAPAPQQAAPTYKPQAKGEFVNGAIIGQCLNLAVNTLGLSKSDVLDRAKVAEAIKWYKESVELFTELYPSVVAGAKPEPKTKKGIDFDKIRTPVEQPPMDLSDDDPI